MGIEAGKFFINLGLTGAEKTLGGLSQVNDHFSGLKTLSTEAKLAILAALAGLERIVSVSAQFGTTTKLTAEALGVQTRELQKWNNAFQIMTGQAGEGATVLKGIHDLMFSIQTGQGASPFFPTLMSALNASGYKYSKDELSKQSNLWLKDPSKFMPELMAMAKLKTTEVAKLAGMLEKSGLISNPQFSALRNITPGVIHQASQESLGNSDIEKLNILNQKWQFLGEILKKDMDEFATAMGPIVDGLIKGAKLLQKVIEYRNEGIDFSEAQKKREKNRSNDSVLLAIHPKLKNILQPMIEHQNRKGDLIVTVSAPVHIEGADLANGINDLDAKLDVAITGIWIKTISKMYSTKAQ